MVRVLNAIRKFFHYPLALYALLAFGSASAMPPQREFISGGLDATQLEQLEAEFGQHKRIPAEYREQILTALSYFPELRTVRIDFVVRKSAIPLSSRPRYASVFRAAKRRHYLITISSQSSPALSPILLKNLSYNAQVGVLGHEISHVANYLHTSAWGLTRIAWGLVFSKSATDRFEAQTDQTCIEHGLGYQLLAWSVDIRAKMAGEEWLGAQADGKPVRERYLRPDTIRQRMRALPLYQASSDENN